MPFVAACPFCPGKLSLAENALGASVRCPKCGNYYTALPSEQPPAKPPLRKRSGRVPRAAPAGAPPQPASAPAENGVAATPGPAIPLPPTVVSSPALPASPYPAWINMWGAVALFLSSLALLFAALGLPRYLIWPLLGLGVLSCLLGVLAAMEGRKRKDVIWLSVSGSLSVVVLGMVLLRPHWLNPRWSMDFTVPEPDLNKKVRVSLETQRVKGDLTDEDSVDALKYAIRQEDVQVRVEKVEVVRALGSRKDQAGSARLLISLHIANVGQLRHLTYQGEKTGKHRPVLLDDRGHSYPVRDAGAGAKAIGQSGTVSLMPNQSVKDVLVFEPPPPGVAHLQLELPAAAWGRKGIFKFKIPREMLAPNPSQAR